MKALSILACMLLILPASCEIFDLGNWSVDTGAYIVVNPSINSKGNGTQSLIWFWSPIKEGEKETQTTVAIIPIIPDNAPTEAVFLTLYDSLNGNRRPDLKNTTADAIKVEKPVAGFMAIVKNQPAVKVFVGRLNEDNCLMVISTEPDDNFGFILNQLRVYRTGEESQTARLAAIGEIAEV